MLALPSLPSLLFFLLRVAVISIIQYIPLIFFLPSIRIRLFKRVYSAYSTPSTVIGIGENRTANGSIQDTNTLSNAAAIVDVEESTDSIPSTTLSAPATQEDDPLRSQLQDYEKKFQEVRNAVETRLYSLSHHPTPILHRRSNIRRPPSRATRRRSGWHPEEYKGGDAVGNTDGSSLFEDVSLSDDSDDDEDDALGLQVEQERRFLTQLLELLVGNTTSSDEDESSDDEGFVVHINN